MLLQSKCFSKNDDHLANPCVYKAKNKTRFYTAGFIFLDFLFLEKTLSLKVKKYLNGGKTPGTFVFETVFYMV
jgi:hypothetical protein